MRNRSVDVVPGIKPRQIVCLLAPEVTGSGHSQVSARTVAAEGNRRKPSAGKVVAALGT